MWGKSLSPPQPSMHLLHPPHIVLLITKSTRQISCLEENAAHTSSSYNATNTMHCTKCSGTSHSLHCCLRMRCKHSAYNRIGTVSDLCCSGQEDSFRLDTHIAAPWEIWRAFFR
ncbi:hypothetical protein EGR_09825 [Echinococcus granulosus]|uniref:Uncharacterized protein n=1 Tax=Echinococcus granulosus TaxID=6210 RepID=W6U2K0_ECHGR|nr:hypothetical protein EGR_09825 [Echinococcus granulosus]EUB55298.1 hypothetical protein EGR_09825 [Echinococcus granulosus]